jgi:hypothetical protein
MIIYSRTEQVSLNFNLIISNYLKPPNFFTDKTSTLTDFFKYIASFCLAQL